MIHGEKDEAVPTSFSKKTLKINAPNSFFQNEPKFVYIILDFFNKFLKT